MPPSDLDRAHALMMAVLDGEATPADREALDALLARDGELAAEWARLRRVKEVTETMTPRQPAEEVWDRFRMSVMHRAERGIAWILIAAGASVLGVWWAWQALEAFVGDTTVPWYLKAAVLAIVAGGAILLVSVIRERWFLHRRDPYSREVIR